MTEIETNIIERAVESITNLINKDAVGAWRAGYDYLHVYNVTGGPTLTTSVATYPAYNEEPTVRNFENYTYAYTLKLEDEKLTEYLQNRR